MNETNIITSNNQLPSKTILYLDSNLTKKCKSLLITLHKYQSLNHKELAELLDIKTSGLTNLISRINKIQKKFIESQSIGRCKFYSLSPLAEAYTEIILLPKENARKYTHSSSLYNDLSTSNVIDSLKKFQEYEGECWYIVLDDLLFFETRNKIITATDFKDEMFQNNMNYKEETYQNYTNFKNALITLCVQNGRQAVQKIYGILDQEILSWRLDSLLSNILNDFYKMEPLFQLEKEDLQAAYSIIDRIFSELFPEIFGASSSIYSEILDTKYSSIYSVIVNMNNEFKKNNYNKSVSIQQWEKKFYTQSHYSCISYIAEKCNTLYIKKS
ncbi:MAG: MarR family winged helix-turn-helix transcriptional regulator [Muribaculaceae bacterium]|nr:MarR family winged helix-turn-helix transcriptional regulator [Muribaculaceae bacterium]